MAFQREFNYWDMVAELKAIGFTPADTTCPCYPYDMIIDSDTIDPQEVETLMQDFIGYCQECQSDHVLNILLTAIGNDGAFLITNRTIDFDKLNIPEHWNTILRNFWNEYVMTFDEFKKRCEKMQTSDKQTDHIFIRDI